ncbi:hypothetical protein AB0K18_12975 [Nonomuraea sp. NPDC049421]|uniref:hypothetical protein n=1 Tax=Nonomuraea sp. NPDC049421 TaxID=3155275 RepID=UPI0034282600
MRVVPVVLSAAVVFSCLPVPAAQAAAAMNATVPYVCTVVATGAKQDVSIDVELTVPAQAQPNEELTIGWTGAYTTGSELLAPATGLEGDIKMYAYAGISGIPNFTSATGVAEIGTVIPDEPIPLPTTTVDLKTTPKNTGTGQVHAASVNFGLRPTEPLIECEVEDTSGRTDYPITVGTAGQDDDDTTPTPDDSDSTTPTDQETEEDTSGTTTEETPEEAPSGGVDTGAGGLAGPDGRALMGIGLVILLAALTGLRLRRPRRS